MPDDRRERPISLESADTMAYCERLIPGYDLGFIDLSLLVPFFIKPTLKSSRFGRSQENFDLVARGVVCDDPSS
jgi:hypothetical protein